MVGQAEIHSKAMSNEVEERKEAAEQLCNNFAVLPDKEQAWNDLIQLTRDKDGDMQWGAAKALGFAFQHIPDKGQAWNDLHRLARDKDSSMRLYAADALIDAFQYIPDKDQAWDDHHRLTRDEVSFVRWSATESLGSAFQHISDKNQAWNDLHRLTQDEDSDVRWSAAEALGSAFPHIPDKGQAWDDLIWLAQDEDRYVRMDANHSLGRASIFKTTAIESEEDFRKELKNALAFFEISLKGETLFNTNPSKFCLPFYKSFYTITFEKAESEAEVQRYIAAAKSATEGSKNKEKLLKAVENLANALTEAQRLREANLDTIKRNLKDAADLIGAAEEKTPGAARVLRRGLPIIDERIKGIIREVRKKSREVYKQTQGTVLEDLGVELNREGKKLLEIRDPIGLGKSVETLHFILSEMCARIPEDKRGFACATLERAKNVPIVEDQIDLINVVLGSILPSIGDIKMSIKIGKIEKSGVQIGGEGNIQQIDVTSGAPIPEHDKHKFALREIVYSAIIDIAIHALVIISIDHYLESSMDKIAPYLIVTFVIVLVITIFALRKLPNAKSS